MSERPIDTIIRLRKAGWTNRAVASAMKITEDRVKKLLADAEELPDDLPEFDRAGALDDHRAMKPTSNEREHLQRLVQAGGYAWLRQDIAQRFYDLEAAPRAGREFWRAA